MSFLLLYFETSILILRMKPQPILISLFFLMLLFACETKPKTEELLVGKWKRDYYAEMLGKYGLKRHPEKALLEFYNDSTLDFTVDSTVKYGIYKLLDDGAYIEYKMYKVKYKANQAPIEELTRREVRQIVTLTTDSLKLRDEKGNEVAYSRLK